MYTFYVVVRHNDSGIFSSLHYRTENKILTERDLIQIEGCHADRSNGMFEVKTQIISWQQLSV